MSLVFSGVEQNELRTSAAQVRAVWSSKEKNLRTSIKTFFIRREGVTNTSDVLWKRDEVEGVTSVKTGALGP